MNAVKISLEDAKALYNMGGVPKRIALLAYSENELSGLPKTWEEFCKDNPINTKTECYIGSESDPVGIYSEERYVDRDWDSDKNLLPNLEAAKAHLALIQLHQLRNYYRQGWIPNWDDNSYKWVINYCSGKYDVSICLNKRFLAFQSEEIAQEFLNNFIDLIELAGDLV